MIIVSIFITSLLLVNNYPRAEVHNSGIFTSFLTATPLATKKHFCMFCVQVQNCKTGVTPVHIFVYLTTWLFCLFVKLSQIWDTQKILYAGQNHFSISNNVP